ncbi:hypothetical protein EGT33_01520 [Burkholderia multivorans]|nr:hypothetical protein EGT33_01520 [Burkholderia multivorans]
MVERCRRCATSAGRVCAPAAWPLQCASPLHAAPCGARPSAAGTADARSHAIAPACGASEPLPSWP